MIGCMLAACQVVILDGRSLSQRWSAALSVSTQERSSTRSKSSLRWSDTTWENSRSLTTQSSTEDPVLVPPTLPVSFLSSKYLLYAGLFTDGMGAWIWDIRL